jgi:hypothetical protein
METILFGCQMDIRPPLWHKSLPVPRNVRERPKAVRFQLETRVRVAERFGDANEAHRFL